MGKTCKPGVPRRRWPHARQPVDAPPWCVLCSTDTACLNKRTHGAAGRGVPTNSLHIRTTQKVLLPHDLLLYAVGLHLRQARRRNCIDQQSILCATPPMTLPLQLAQPCSTLRAPDPAGPCRLQAGSTALRSMRRAPTIPSLPQHIACLRADHGPPLASPQTPRRPVYGPVYTPSTPQQLALLPPALPPLAPPTPGRRPSTLEH